ncbi:hypothetical protein ACGFZQ_30090 [Streptomyces sp. NPDC048254]|uniref:hypothetical protein n=1 Tax=Streptomyces sp. NPDC048254 TaxID=3365525 RepID=UPI0037247562
MKSERPENDDAAAGTGGEPPEARTTESPKAAEPDARPSAEPAESTARPTRDRPTAKPETAPAPEETPEPAAPPAAETAPEPTASPAPTAADDAAETAEPDATPEPAAPPAAETDPEPAGSPRSAVAPSADRDPAPDETPKPETARKPQETPAPESQGTPAPDPAPQSPESSGPDRAPQSQETPESEVASLPGVGAVFGGDSGHPARRRSPAVIASVAAAVLLIGGGGAYLAASGGSGGGTGTGAGTSASGGSTPPPLALDGYSTGGNGIAAGEPNPYGMTYKAGGTLPDGPGSAAVYQPAGEVSKDRVAALAKALGIDGTPVAEGGVWKVGTDNDGSGGSLQVNRATPGIWTYSRYAPGTDNCKSGLVCAQDPAAPAGDPVSVSVAEKAAAPVLKALGQDDAKLDTSQVMGAQRAVNADPVVGGLPTYGWTTGLTVSKQGEVVGGNGMLATPAKGDTYPVLSAEKTLGLMNAAPRSDHRMGIGGCASSVPLKDRLEQPCSASTSSASPAASAVIDNAVFGLAAQSVGGRQALVPSWLFQVRGAANSYTVTYPAVDPKYLASAASPTPSSSPGTPKDVKVDGYTADGSELTVAFTGGVCADYKASADEGSEQVVVKVTETPWPDKICILIAKQYHQTVRLDAPLDGRKVVGTDGTAVPKEKATTLDPQVG